MLVLGMISKDHSLSTIPLRGTDLGLLRVTV